ncbi:MAG: hypothetical protein ACI4SR_06810 [Faecalibacillus sp.]
MSELLQYKCPCCGGSIEFDSSLQKMKCPYCDSEFELETLKQYDVFLNQTQEDKFEWNNSHLENYREDETKNINVYLCESCGGEIIADETTSATNCPFCGNPVIIKSKLAGNLKPDYIIPFKIDKKQAKEALKNYTNGKLLVPKAFKDENHLDEIKGIYVPFWLFDSKVDVTARYHATRTRFWSDSRYDYTETSHFAILREGTMNFENVPVDGSIQMDDQMMESIEPFHHNEAVDFQTAYLSGYLANKYDVSVEESIVKANERIKKSAEQSIAETVKGYSTVIPESSSIQLIDGIHHYALYPVWFLNTSWNDQKYTFVMNGQTGKFIGDLPMDKNAFIKWFIIIAVIVSILAFLFMCLVLR